MKFPANWKNGVKPNEKVNYCFNIPNGDRVLITTTQWDSVDRTSVLEFARTMMEKQVSEESEK